MKPLDWYKAEATWQKFQGQVHGTDAPKDAMDTIERWLYTKQPHKGKEQEHETGNA